MTELESYSLVVQVQCELSFIHWTLLVNNYWKFFLREDKNPFTLMINSFIILKIVMSFQFPDNFETIH